MNVEAVLTLFTPEEQEAIKKEVAYEIALEWNRQILNDVVASIMKPYRYQRNRKYRRGLYRSVKR